jgi:hypothetical protein
MPDIISAKCFGCGNVVKVPAALGGKKARCPKCTNTISIPALSDTSEDLVGDELLPEVAREDEDLEGKFVDDDGVVQDLHPHPSPPARRGGSPRNQRGRGGRGGGRGGGQRAPGPKAKSSTGLVIGIVVGVLVVVVLIAVAAGNKGDAKAKPHGTTKEKPPPASATQENSEDSDLWMRCLDYTRAVNSGSLERIMKYYAYEPDDERAVTRGINRIIGEGVRYDSPVQKSSSAATGTVTFSYSGGEKTLSWKKVNGQWLIADKP